MVGGLSFSMASPWKAPGLRGGVLLACGFRAVGLAVVRRLWHGQKGMVPGRIALTDAEARILAQIDFSPSGHDASSWGPIGAASLALMDSLVARKGIPTRRLRLFTDPRCFVGGHGRSHLETFEKNGTRGDDVFRHPHFVLKYLRFFIDGPDLPGPLVAAFGGEVRACGNITSGDIDTLCKVARRLAREYGLNHLAVEEFFRLALDCDLDAGDARAIRDAVQTLR